MNEKTFDEPLDDAINKFLAGGGDIEAVMSALELKLMTLKEEQDGSDE